MNGQGRMRTPGTLEEKSPDILAYRLSRTVRRPARRGLWPPGPVTMSQDKDQAQGQEQNGKQSAPSTPREKEREKKP